MKNCAVCLVGFAALAAAPAAVASNTYDPNLDIVFTFNPITFTSTATGGVETAVLGGNLPGNVVGFSFEFDFTNAGASAAWASDLKLEVALNGTVVYDIGGFGAENNNDWDFQGAGSAPDGFYSHGPDFALKGLASGINEWEFTFFNAWLTDLDNAILAENAKLTIHRIPAPGALALLAFAGLATTRRRRR